MQELNHSDHQFDLVVRLVGIFGVVVAMLLMAYQFSKVHKLLVLIGVSSLGFIVVYAKGSV